MTMCTPNCAQDGRKKTLKQERGWTYGALANHVWSVAGDDDRADINSTYLQPFLAFTTRTYTTFGANTEATYDWKAEEWSIPLHLSISQILKIGAQPLSIQVAARHWVDSPPNGPQGTSYRVVAAFLFPK